MDRGFDWLATTTLLSKPSRAHWFWIPSIKKPIWPKLTFCPYGVNTRLMAPSNASLRIGKGDMLRKASFFELAVDSYSKALDLVSDSEYSQEIEEAYIKKGRSTEMC
eukprot:gb/GECG01014045.1/.p1 GENE.gb/GECG01014045.1/~~gb/GECG01014045.1/.p1  ORF type:complete len:107 (+),score=7.02 gb/GECG01014045.1/:1-321(+)